MASLLVVALIAAFIYKSYLSQSQTPGIATPIQTIDVVGVKNDLLSIAQAERMYLAEHGSYASLSDLTTSGAMSLAKTGRDGYTYEVQTAAESFHVFAHCPVSTTPSCTSYSIDQTMEIQTAP